MKRYEKYTTIPSTVSPEMPDAWTAKKLKFVLSYTKGKQPSQLTEEPVGDPYATMDYLRGRDCILQYPVSTEGLVHIDNDSLLVLWDGANAGEFLHGKAGYLGSTMAVVEAGDNMDKSYLFYLLKGSEALSKMIAGGTTIPHFSPSFFDEIFAIPSLDEQQKIAAFLDYKTGKIDRLTEMLTARIDDLKKYRQALTLEVVTHGLNKSAKMKDSGVTWIGSVPDTWEVCKLKFVTRLQSGTNLTSEQISDDGLYPVFGGNGIRGYYSDYKLEGDHVLIGRQGALCGNINYASGRFWPTEHAVVCYPYIECPVRWLGELLRSMNLNQYSESAAQPGLAVERIANLYIPVPSTKERIEIAEYLECKIKQIDDTIAATDQQIKDLQAYRASFISEAVTGQIDVRDWTAPEK